jgi:hypothetical protein
MYQMAVIETGISLAPRAARVGSRGERGSGVLHSSIAVVAGVDLAFGVLHVCTGVRRPSHRTRNLLFGFFALAHSGAIMTARAAFMVDTVDQFASAVHTNTVVSALSFVCWVGLSPPTQRYSLVYCCGPLPVRSRSSASPESLAPISFSTSPAAKPASLLVRSPAPMRYVFSHEPNS